MGREACSKAAELKDAPLGRCSMVFSSLEDGRFVPIEVFAGSLIDGG